MNRLKYRLFGMFVKKSNFFTQCVLMHTVVFGLRKSFIKANKLKGKHILPTVDEYKLHSEDTTTTIVAKKYLLWKVNYGEIYYGLIRSLSVGAKK